VSTPQISIILPTRNRLSTIKRTIEHVQAQTLTDWELIISDNASTDAGKVDYLRGLAAVDPRVKVHAQAENIGIQANWSFCINQCAGKYYIPVTDDDWWGEETYLASLLAMHDGRVGCVFPNFSMHILDTGEVTENALTAVYGGVTSRYEMCERLVADGKGMVLVGLFNLAVIPKQEIIRAIDNGLVISMEMVGINRIVREHDIRFCANASYHHTVYGDNFARGFGQDLQMRDRGIATFMLLNDLRVAADKDPGYAQALAGQWKVAVQYCDLVARARALNNESGHRFLREEKYQELKAEIKTLKSENKGLARTVSQHDAALSSPWRALRAWWRRRRKAVQ